MTPQEAGFRGGMATLERYGADHFRRITKGRKRRARHQDRRPRLPAGNEITTGGAPSVK